MRKEPKVGDLVRPCDAALHVIEESCYPTALLVLKIEPQDNSDNYQFGSGTSVSWYIMPDDPEDNHLEEPPPEAGCDIAFCVGIDGRQFQEFVYFLDVLEPSR